jgi:hypothetical protein
VAANLNNRTRQVALAGCGGSAQDASHAHDHAADGAHEVASAALAARRAAASPAVYPQLDALPLDELQAWESRQCDWSRRS